MQAIIINVLPYTGRETLDEANSEYQALPQPAGATPSAAIP